MKVYEIDYNPDWGTRFQHERRRRLGPFSTSRVADAVRRRVCVGLGLDLDTPLLRVLELEVDPLVRVENPYDGASVEVASRGFR